MQSFTLRPVMDSNVGAAQTSRPQASVLNTRSGVASSTSRSPIVGVNGGGPERWDRMRSFIVPRKLMDSGTHERSPHPEGSLRPEVSTWRTRRLSTDPRLSPPRGAGAGDAASTTVRAPMTPPSSTTDQPPEPPAPGDGTTAPEPAERYRPPG